MSDSPKTPANVRFVRSAATGAVDLLVYGDLGEWGDVSAKAFADALQQHESERVRVCINSYGGDAFAGHAIYSQLRRHKGGVDTVVDGIAASAASIVAMAGETRTMGTGTMMMVHNPWTIGIGEADDFRKTAEMLDRVRDNLIAVYEERTGLPRDRLQELLDKETWMTADEAVELGFATEVSTAVSASIKRHGHQITANGILFPMAPKPPAPTAHAHNGDAMGITSNMNNHIHDTGPGGPAAPSPTAKSEDPQAYAAQAVAAERERYNSIRRTAQALVLPAAFAQEHIDNGTSADEFRALAIDEHARRTKPVVSDAGRARISAGEDERDKWLRGASYALLHRASVARVVQQANKSQGISEDLDPGEFRGRTLLDLARDSLERDGISTKGRDKREIFGMALTQRGVHAMGGLHSTGDFAVLLENTLHKTLLAAYAITPDKWSRFCAVGTVSDFRPHKRYRMGTFGRLDNVNEHGEFKNKEIPDARKEQIEADTVGNIIGITRQALINDDLSAFSRLAMLLGRAARLSIEVDVFDLIKSNGGLGPLMADGKTLFHADHGNINSSASSLSVDGIDADRVVLASQTDESGNEILDLEPSILLVPKGLEGRAMEVNAQEFNDETNKNQRRPSSVRGLFNEIVGTARLSGTRRYLFADPMIAPTFEVAFLDGQQEPFMEMQDGWHVDGVEWKVRLDYAVAGIDYRGAVTNAGA